MRFSSLMVAILLVGGCSPPPHPKPRPRPRLAARRAHGAGYRQWRADHGRRRAQGGRARNRPPGRTALSAAQAAGRRARRAAPARSRGCAPRSLGRGARAGRDRRQGRQRHGTRIDTFIAANQSRIRGDATQLRPQIREFLQQQKTDTRRTALVDVLRAAAKVEMRLTPPVPFRAEVDIAGAPVRGTATAPVTIIEYSDFHCPFCRRVQPTLTALLAKYPGKVRLVYKHLPLDGLHPQARRVSEAAWCAGKQDKFWGFHDAVYADSGNDASDATLTRYATTAGLDAPAFTSCLANPETRAAIERDVAQGEALGLNSTPGSSSTGGRCAARNRSRRSNRSSTRNCAASAAEALRAFSPDPRKRTGTPRGPAKVFGARHRTRGDLRQADAAGLVDPRHTDRVDLVDRRVPPMVQVRRRPRRAVHAAGAGLLRTHHPRRRGLRRPRRGRRRLLRR